jgi:hypothetical protein
LMAMEFRSADLTDIAACVVWKSCGPRVSGSISIRRSPPPLFPASPSTHGKGKVAVWVPMVVMLATRTAVLIRGQVPGRLEVHRPAVEAGRRFTLAFVLAVAAVRAGRDQELPGGR